MELVNLTRHKLIRYTTAQIDYFFPDNRHDIRSHLELHMDEALDRLQKCINAVRCWNANEFNYLHSSQYCTYLYFLSNTLWRNTHNVEVCTKLFLLNKVLNGIDCFYEIEMPDIFFIGHSVGIVLAKAAYSNYLVLYQNSTVGKNAGVAPEMESGVIMYPNTAIIGCSKIRANTIVSQGVGIVNRDTPGGVMVFQQGNGDLLFKKIKKDYLHEIFRS
jgi:serine O-acetyltransferase